MKDIIVNNRYRVEYRIGEGGFGLVYAGTDIELDEEVAIKMTHIRDDYKMLRSEAETYTALSGGVGIPRVRWVGYECEYYVLVHDLLGPSLEDLLNYCGRQFSLKTILLLADQAISRIEFIHNKGFLHRDIKPDNFLMGSKKQGNILYAIDFGLAKEFSDAERDQKWERRGFGGTSRYASLNNHCGREQSRGDDLESLGYVLIYFANGSLPWQGLKGVTEEEKNELIKEKKMTLPVETLCKELPSEFAQYITYTRSLQFEDRPNYVYLRQLFRNVFKTNSFRYDNIFDWTEKRFYEIHNKAEQSDSTAGASKPQVSKTKGRVRWGTKQQRVSWKPRGR